MRWFLCGSIQARLVRLLGLSIGVTAVMAVVIWRVGIAPALQLALMEKQRETAKRASEQIDHFLEQRITELKTAVQFGALSRERPEHLKEKLLSLLQASPQIVSLTVIDSQGQSIVTVDKNPRQLAPALQSYRSTLVYTHGRLGRVHVSEVLYSSGGEPFVTIGIPINANAEVEAVMAAEVSLKRLWDSISAIEVGTAGQLYIVSPGGSLIAHRDASKVSLNLNVANLDVVSRFLRKEPNSPTVHLGESGKPSLVSYSIVSRSGWGVFAEEPVDSALAPIRRVEWLAGALLLFTMFGSFVLSHRFSLRISRPIRLLERATQLISQGQLSQKVVFHSGDEVQSLAESFNRMADALKASYDDLEAKIIERTADISGLYAALAPVNPVASLDEMFGTVIQRVLQATGGTFAMLRFQRSDRSFSEYTIEEGFVARYRHIESIGLPGSAAEAAFNRGTPIVCTDITTDLRFRRDEEMFTNARSCAILPLIVSGNVRGVIHLANRTPGHFKPEKKDHLMAIMYQMGVTIENHQLFAETERHRRDNETLYTVTDAMQRSLRIPTLLDTALTMVLEKFCFDAGVICLVNENNGALAIAAHKGLDDADFTHVANQTLPRLFTDILVRNQPHFLTDLREGHYLDGVATSFEKLLSSFISAAGFPISTKNIPSGVLLAFNRHKRRFSLEEMALLSHVGKQIGVAVENARLYEEIRKQAVDLEKSGKIKDDFLCVVSHELKTPLLAISGYTTLLQDGVLGGLTADQQRATGVIERNSRDLMHMVHSILEAAKLQNHTVNVQRHEVAVPALLEELAQTYPVQPDKPVEIHWRYDRALPVLITDRDKLKHVLQNLVYNALKFTEAGRVTISASYCPDGEAVKFEVHDTGIGIPAEQLPLIYEKFRQLDGAPNRGYEGAGLGLYIVREFTRLLGGVIEVESQPGQGSCFTVTIPRAVAGSLKANNDTGSKATLISPSQADFTSAETPALPRDSSGSI
jgi:signal transduction histidine kinase